MKIIVIGGGFAGLKFVQELKNKDQVEVLLLDKVNYHQFQPLFYQVATAGLDASNISFPLRKVFHDCNNVKIRITNVSAIDSDQNKVITDTGTYEYDILVIATGAGTNFFGNANIASHAFPMKSTLEALQLKNHIINNFEQILQVHTIEERQRYLNFVIVGAGPTGVELSGALAEMKTHILPKDYPEIDFSKMTIHLLEGSGKTLAAMSEASSKQSQQYLEQLGVTVMLNTVVKDYDGKTVLLNDGKTIESNVVIWAAGIKGNVPSGISPDLIVRGNRIKVDRYNRVIGSTNIYAIGDIAYMETPLYKSGHPQLANVAINQGKNLGKNILESLKKSTIKNLKEFEYSDKGSMATVGKAKAVVDIPKPKIHIGGWLAWIIWMSLHLMLILGVKNKFQIFINWFYKYFTNDQSLRLATKEDKQPTTLL